MKKSMLGYNSFDGMMAKWEDEELNELYAARNCVEDIIEKLPLIYKGENVNLNVGVSGAYLSSILRGLEAIKTGSSGKLVIQYFRLKLKEISDDIEFMQEKYPKIFEKVTEKLDKKAC